MALNHPHNGTVQYFRTALCIRYYMLSASSRVVCLIQLPVWVYQYQMILNVCAKHGLGLLCPNVFASTLISIVDMYH